MKSVRSKFPAFVICLSVILFGIMLTSFAKSNEYYSVRTITLPDGKNIDKIVIKSLPIPQVGYERVSVKVPESNFTAGINVLDVPAFDWSYGSSPTSAAMIAGYYDRTGYPYMYTGPTNGGVMPLDNSAWGLGECPLSATHNGFDGRTIMGHVDDYWISNGSADPDPFIGNWTEHDYGDCAGDYMKSNQSNYYNPDGATTFWFATDGSPTYWHVLEGAGVHALDGGYGLKLFYESRGYTVIDMYNQFIDARGLTYGFTYAQYCAEIDAGRPVMIHLAGHTVVGFGYDNSSDPLVYIHDAWDHDAHEMTWGGSYQGLEHFGVSIVQLGGPRLVYFDIKPQSWPNPLNTKTKGILPVAILGTSYFNVTTIDPITVLLEGIPPLRWNIEDVSTPDGDLEDDCNATTAGADGYDDLTLKFDKQAIVAALGPVNDGDVVVLTVSGNLFDGSQIEGRDCVVIRSMGENAEINIIKPDHYALYPSYPNPFNPMTTISYALPEDSRVELSIYNTLGQKVATLVKDHQPAGEYQLRWQPQNLPSGVYITCLRAGDYRQIGKMLYIK